MTQSMKLALALSAFFLKTSKIDFWFSRSCVKEGITDKGHALPK